MAHRNPLSFTEEARRRLAHGRYHHPHPRVRQRMEYLWLISVGESQQRAAELAGVSRATAWRYEESYRHGGVQGLEEVNWQGTESELSEHREALAVEFAAHPPHTVDEAAERIERLTGLRRRPTAVREFMRSLGLRWRRVGAVPAPPKKTSPSTPAIRRRLFVSNWSPA